MRARGSCELRAPRVAAAAPRSPRSARATPTRAPRHALGKSYSDVVRGFRGRFEHPPDFVALPARRAGCSSGCSSGARRARRRDPLRRRHVGRRRRHPGCRPRLQRRRLDRPGRPRPRAGGRSRSRARRSIQARRHRSRPRGPAGRARPDAPPLPPVLRVLHPGRLDRHAGRRATSPRVWTHIEDFVESVRAITPGRACGSRGGCPARARV